MTRQTMSDAPSAKVCRDPKCAAPLPVTPPKPGRVREYCNSTCRMRHYYDVNRRAAR